MLVILFFERKWVVKENMNCIIACLSHIVEIEHDFN